MSISLNFISSFDNRLDVAIFNELGTELTRSQIQKYILEQGVYVNGVQVLKHGFKIFPGNEIKLNWGTKTKDLDHDLVSKIEVLAETENYAVILKPPGLVVHSGAGHNGDTLADWLAQKYPEQAQMQAEGDPEDTHDNPHVGGGLVHRLDKDTQGLMLVARDYETLRFFQSEFKSRNVEKYYLAVLDGKLDFEVDLDGFQARTRRNVLKQYFTLENILEEDILAKINKNHPIKGDWRNSHSVFKPLFYCKETNQTLVQIQIFTGRMHQIRVQAEFLGFPLLQDPLYKIPSTPNLENWSEKFPNKIVLKSVEVKDLGKVEFYQKIAEVFGFVERSSFFLKAFKLKIALPDGNFGEFGE